MSALPLLNLPRLAFERVHGFLSLKDIIELSLCSKHMKTRLSSMETLIKCPKMEVVLSSWKNWLVLEDEQRKRGKFEISAHYELDGDLVDLKDFLERRADGRDWKMGYTPTKWMCLGSELPEADLIFWIQYLSDIFNFTISELYLDFSKKLDFDLVFRATKLFHKAQTVEFQSFGVSHEEMTFLLDNLKVEDLKLHVNPGNSFRYPKPINFLKLDLICSSWLTEENLLQMANVSEKIDLNHGPWLQDQFLNTLIKNWLTSDNQILKYVHLSGSSESDDEDNEFHFDVRDIFQRRPPPFDEEKFLDGLGAVDGVKKRADASPYFERNREYENGADITRKDGKVATIWLKAWFGSIEFAFTVWDVPFPNLVEE